MGASVATFDDTMADIVYELDDREIFNDIRSEIEVSETIVVDDSGWVTVVLTYTDRSLVLFAMWLPGGEDASYEFAWTLTFPPGVTMADLVSGEWKGTHIFFNTGTNSVESVPFSIPVSFSGDDLATVVVPGKIGDPDYNEIYTGDVLINYNTREWQEASHEEVLDVIWQVRAVDSTSIDKYGRRVLKLVWPMGASQEQAQSIIDSYLTRYSEPEPRVLMTIKGSTDALRVQILTRKVSDKITAISSDLGLNADFFINKISYGDEIDKIPMVSWTLEQERASEDAGVFVIDTSFIDSDALIG